MTDMTPADIRIRLEGEDRDALELAAEGLEAAADRLVVELAPNPETDPPVECVVRLTAASGMPGGDFRTLDRRPGDHGPITLDVGRPLPPNHASDAPSGLDRWTSLADRIETLVARERIQQAAGQAEPPWRSLFEQSAGTVFTVDDHGTIVHVSPSVSRVLGYRPDEFCGSAFDYVHPGDRDRAREAFASVLAHPGVETRIEFRARRRDGSWRWLDVKGRNAIDDSTVAGVIVAAREITEQRHRAAIFDAFRAAYPDVAFISDGNGAILQCLASPESRSLLQHDPEDLIGRRLDVVHPPDSTAYHERLIQRAIESGDSQTFEYQLDLPDGTRWFEARIAPVPAAYHDEPTVVSAVRDVTEAREREQRVRAERNRLQAGIDATSQS